MEKKKLSVFENMIWNTIGSFTYLICQWLLTLIVVRISSDMENAGNLALAISITNIFFNLANFNVRPYLISDLKNRYTSNEYSAFRMLTGSFSIIGCAVYSLLFGYSDKQFIAIMLYMLFKLGESWVDLLHGFEQRVSRMDIGGISLFVRGILSIFSFSVTLYYTDDVNKSIAVMAISTISFIVVYDCTIASKFVNYVPKINVQKTTKMFFEFLPVTVGSFVNTVSATVPRQVLEAKMGSDTLGYYSTIATPAVIVQVAASYVFNPVLTQFALLYNENKKSEFVKLVIKISGVLVTLSIICIVGALILGEWGLVFLYGERIQEYVYLFMPVIYYTCLNAFVWFFWILLVIMRKMKHLLIINIVGAIFCLGIMNPIISVCGMNGVSYTMIAYSIVILLMMLSVMVKEICK